ncbi:hypothetical protein ACRU3B_10700 [Mycobacterium colombiense]
MSGALVGEVIHAAGVLKAKGLSESAFHALIAIAEKCHHASGQGSVPWIHISNGIYGRKLLPSKRTAERAVRELKDAGLIRVVRPGFNNNYGRSCAPVYEISLPTDTDIHVSESDRTDTDVQVSRSPRTDTDKTGTDTDKTGDRYRHLDVVLNGSTNGSTNYKDDGIVPLYVETGTRPPRRHPSSAAKTVVRQELGDVGYPRTTTDRLAVQVEKLAHEGHPDTLIREALHEWDRREDCTKPEFLATVLGDIVKRRRAVPNVDAGGLSDGEAKVFAWASLGAPTPKPQKAIE